MDYSNQQQAAVGISLTAREYWEMEGNSLGALKIAAESRLADGQMTKGLVDVATDTLPKLTVYATIEEWDAAAEAFVTDWMASCGLGPEACDGCLREHRTFCAAMGLRAVNRLLAQVGWRYREAQA